MPGTKKVIGYDPADHPLGWGATNAGVLRGTTFPANPKAYWITRAGGRFGKTPTGAATTMRVGIYDANPSTMGPGARKGNTGLFSVSKSMADRVSGGDYEAPVLQPIPVSARRPITIAPMGTGAGWVHGQDNSGALMYEDPGNGGGLPVTFDSTNTRPEGRIAAHAVVYEDAAPTIPLWEAESGGVSPGHGWSVVDETPTIEFDFRSTNEKLPGFEIGDADRLTKYQVHVLNSAKTVKLHDSGLQGPTAGEVEDRRVSWTVPAALSPGRYTIRAQVYNYFNTPSAWREWTINVVGSGSIAVTGPTGTINDDTPDISWAYSHKQGLAMDALYARVLDKAGNVIRGNLFINFTSNPAAGSTGSTAWADTGWDALPVGADYSFQVQAVDTDGQPSSWSAPQAFHLNAPPYTPNFREPLPGTILTSIPELRALIRDPETTAASVPAEFQVRKAADAEEAAVEVPSLYNRAANRWVASPQISGAISTGEYDDYLWRVRATDPEGASSAWSTWLAFKYVAPPVVTEVEPVGIIATANPAFQWSIDRAQESYRLQLFYADTGDPVRGGDTGWVISSTTEHQFADLLLRHEDQIRARVDVLTPGDIPGFVEWEFSVEYVAPPAVTGVAVQAVAMEQDFPGTATGLEVSWTPVTTPPIDFDSYLVMRRNPADESVIPLALLFDPEVDSWVDDTAPSGVVFEYQVMQRVRTLLDVIPSLPATATGSIDRIVGMILTPVVGGGDRVVLPYLDALDDTPISDQTVRQSWARKPRTSRGPTDYVVLQVEAPLVEDAAGRYSAADARDRVRALFRTWVDAEGRTRARTVCARLWDGRVVYGTITNLNEGSGDNVTRRVVSLEITETSFDPGVL